jgi:hypothetical protein
MKQVASRAQLISGVISQKIQLFITTAVRTSNPLNIYDFFAQKFIQGQISE